MGLESEGCVSGECVCVCVIIPPSSSSSVLSESGLLELLLVQSSLLGFLGDSGLVAEETATPLLSQGLALIVLGLEDLNEVLELSVVLSGDLSNGNASSGLLVDDSAESSLALDEAERDVLLSAKLGEPDDGLNGVNIVSNDNESSLLLLNELGDVVQTELDRDGGLGAGFLVISFVLGGLEQSLLSLLSVLGLDLSEEVQEGGGLISVDSLGELVDGGGDLQSLEKNSLLSLEQDVLGPSNVSSKVSSGSNVTTNSEVSRLLLEQGVLLDLGGLAGLGALFKLSLSHFL